MEDVIDVHTHFYPKAFLDLISDEGKPFDASVDYGNPNGPVIHIGSRRPSSPLRKPFFDLNARVKEMDQAGIQTHVLSMASPMIDWAKGQFAAKLSRIYNNTLNDAHIAFPDRFVGLATLPFREPDLALIELERVASLPGIRGVYVGTNIEGQEISDEEFHPIWGRMESLGLPLFLHPPPSVIGSDRLTGYHLRNILGNPFDTAVAATRLMFSGMLDKFSSLDICLPHGGGAFPFLVGRMTKGWEVREECRHLERPPTEYVRRFRYDTVTHSSDALEYLIEAAGSDRIMVGSDYCFDMGYDDPVAVVKGLKRVRTGDKTRILRTNAAQLLKIN